MFPLSQYSEGELTSVVTLVRPANSLDMFQELEAALDAGVSARCVPRHSASLDGILYLDHPTKLGKKLRASLAKHRHQLVTDNLRSYFECELRSG
ncbi:hypothetical protein MTO96_013685 [Rhipicephalus appendiculatus]